MTLVFALVLAQMLGLMHGVVHDVGHDPQQGALHQEVNENLHKGNWLASLFSFHDGDHDCRLYDQASHGSAAPAVAPVNLPAALPPAVVAIFQSEALARWAALFDARGPPLTL
ncbi:MAG: hypothetical protein H7228_11630 [Polaromonas sp.]|nr:hypothetical protein [Polaromonas sp.]